MAPSERIQVAGSVRSRSSNARLIRKVDSEEKIAFTVWVRRHVNAPPLPDLEFWQRQPLRQRTFLSSEQYTEKYGASQDDMRTVTSYLADQGLRILRQHRGMRTVTVEATAEQINVVFGVELNHFEAPLPSSSGRMRSSGSRNRDCIKIDKFHGYDGHVTIPTDLKDVITAVIGLDNRTIAVPAFTGDPNDTDPTTFTGFQTVPDIAGLYNFPNLEASDQTIGVFAGGGNSSAYLSSDITSYISSLPTGFQTAPTVRDVPLTVGITLYSNNTSLITSGGTIPNDAFEITQDISTAAAIAQGCTANVYFSDLSEEGWMVFLNRVLFPQDEKQPTVVTISYIMFDETGYGSDFSDLFQQLATVGINVFAASGDWGSDDQLPGAAHVGYPASDPWVTSVGGTIVGNVSSTTPAAFDEVAWSDAYNSSSPFGSNSDFGATGGGMSSVFSTPPYQTDAGVTEFKDSKGTIQKGFRFVPDIAGMVAYSGFLMNGSGYSFTGTSCATPLYAGLFATLRSALGRSLGILNPTLYQLGTQAFRDVTFGNNDSGDTPAAPYYKAGVGYDPTTGWGSVDGTKMLNSLAKLLFPPDMYVQVVKNTFGLAEVQSNPNWDSTLYVVLDGYAPSDVGSTVPNLVSTFGPNVTLSVGTGLPEIASQPDAPQRILFPVSIRFLPNAIHPINDPTTPGIFPAAGSSQFTKSVIVDITVLGQSLEAICEINLLAGADPYFSNLAFNPTTGSANEWWLSQDLRIFTVTPGINPGPIGTPKLTPRNNFEFDSAAGYRYITDLLNYLNGNFVSASGPDALALLPNQSSALSEDSLVAPRQRAGPAFANYNFAVARVRINASSSSKPVKAFFRLFTSNHPQTWYLPASSYASDAPAGLPEKPLVATDLTSIPFFASGNYQGNSDYGVNTDYDASGINSRQVSVSLPSYVYFGCYLNVFPPANTISANGATKAVSAYLAGGHQCLVSQIAFDDAPIETVNGVLASPENSDKLAQRNLQVTLSDNPGPADSHLIPQTFDIPLTADPLSRKPDLVDRPDELMIDWGNAPVGSVASIFWPAIQATEVVKLARRLYPTHQLRVAAHDANTIEVHVPHGFTYVPIPFGNGPNVAGLITIQLPQGVVQGQEFLLTVRRIATRQYEIITITRSTADEEASPPASSPAAVVTNEKQALLERPRPISRITNWRYSAGIFAIRIPVSVPGRIVPIERDLQAIIAWRINQISSSDRWYPVLQRYLSYINRRVDALDPQHGPVVPSPYGACPTPSTCHHSHPCPPSHPHYFCHQPKASHGCCQCDQCRQCHECEQEERKGSDHGPTLQCRQCEECKRCQECQPEETQVCNGQPSSKVICSCLRPRSHSHQEPDKFFFAGKVSGLAYDRFGDFSGFCLALDSGTERRFISKGRETNVENLVTQAWRSRDRIEVVVQAEDMILPVSITLKSEGIKTEGGYVRRY
jgi:kumamolisin